MNVNSYSYLSTLESFHCQTCHLSRVYRFGLASFIIVIATLVRWWAHDALGPTSPYITYYAAVIAAAGLGGLGPGIFTTVCGMIFGYTFFLADSPFVFDVEVMRLGLYLVSGAAISWFAGQLRTQKLLAEDRERQLQEHRDNLERLVSERTEQLKRNERHYRTLVTNAPMKLAVFSKDFHYVHMPPVPEDHYNHSVGKSWSDIGILKAEWLAWQEKFDEVLTTRRKTVYETKYTEENGELRNLIVYVVPEIDDDGQVESFMTFALDITERKRMEVELLRLDRLNIVGEMAAAIGHEVRNPMTTVRGYLQLMQRRKESSKDQEQIMIMIEELDRANNIITEFLSLAKDKSVEMKHHKLNVIISTLLPLLNADALRVGHEIKPELESVPEASLDESEIRQLLLNLARNSFDAMQPGGVLTIRTSFEDDMIVLTVSDTGSGIPPEILENLGKPFLTSKDNGTGLGIPVCYRVAERHGGKIEVHTSPKGTTFFIRIPKI